MLPARAAESARAFRSTFVRSTRLAVSFWIPVTAVTAACAPFLLVRMLGPSYRPAVALVPALALQTLALGAGVGLGSAFRALDRVGWSIGLHLATLLALTPVGFLLVQSGGAAGAAWFHASRTGVAVAAGLAVVLRLTRRPPSGPAPDRERRP